MQQTLGYGYSPHEALAQIAQRTSHLCASIGIDSPFDQTLAITPPDAEIPSDEVEHWKNELRTRIIDVLALPENQAASRLRSEINTDPE